MWFFLKYILNEILNQTTLYTGYVNYIYAEIEVKIGSFKFRKKSRFRSSKPQISIIVNVIVEILEPNCLGRVNFILLNCKELKQSNYL